MVEVVVVGDLLGGEDCACDLLAVETVKGELHRLSLVEARVDEADDETAILLLGCGDGEGRDAARRPLVPERFGVERVAG